MKNIKQVLKIVIGLVILILVGIFSLSYIINRNRDYSDDISNVIISNYNVDGEITYANLYGNYYIFTTSSNVIVLNREYEEVLKEDISYLCDNPNGYELIYKTNTLMYENTILDGNKITYEYYDVKNYKKISSTVLEK